MVYLFGLFAGQFTGVVEAAPAFELENASRTMREGETFSFRVRLTEQPPRTVTASVAIANIDAAFANTPAANLSWLRTDWAQWRTITVVASEENSNEIGGSAVVTLHETSPLSNNIPDATITLRELDNDGQIAVSGTLAADTEWNRTDRDYTITSTVTVPVGVKLTIGPGVRVRQDGTARILYVDGVLEASGAEFILRTHATSGPTASVEVRNSGSARFTGCTLRSEELYSNANTVNYVSGPIFARNSATVRLEGNDFEFLQGWKPSVPVSAVDTASVTWAANGGDAGRIEGFQAVSWWAALSSATLRFDATPALVDTPG